MSKSTSQQSWRFLTEDVEAILEGLLHAEFDHIYPANPTLFDRFLAYLGEAGVRETLDQFSDPRQRRSSPVRFLTQTLLVRPLFAVSSLVQLGPVLSTNAAVLQLLGFNAEQHHRHGLAMLLQDGRWQVYHRERIIAEAPATVRRAGPGGIIGATRIA